MLGFRLGVSVNNLLLLGSVLKKFIRVSDKEISSLDYIFLVGEYEGNFLQWSLVSE